MKNCLTISIRYRFRNPKSRILVNAPECFKFNLLKPRQIVSYLQYIKSVNMSIICLFIPHFYIIDGNYEIHSTSDGIKKIPLD